MKKKVKLISFDETGKFERNEKQARFIGGIVYNGEDYLEEEKRLKTLFKKIASDFNYKNKEKIGFKIKFPNNFHMSNVLNYKTKEVKKESKIKNYIIRETIKYLENNGNYELFMFAAPNTDSVKNEDNYITKSNNLSNLNEPGNLYERLAILTVYNFVFYSLDRDTERNIFKLPTRTLDKLGDHAGEKFEDNGNGYFVNTNKNTFKAAISTKIYEGNAVNNLAVNDLDLSAESINYKEGESSAFLYLSDIICLYLQQKLTYINGEEFAINSNVIKKLKESIKKDIILWSDDSKENMNLDIIFWIYDKIDGIWKKSIEAYADKHIAKVYSYLYDIRREQNEYGKYYVKQWVPKLEKIILEDYIKKDDNVESFQVNIFKDIEEVEYCMREKKDYDKAEYIAKQLIKIINSYLNKSNVKNINTRTLKEALFKLNDVLLRSSNHKPSVKDSEEYLKEIIKLKEFISFDKYIEIINRSMQIYFNLCDFDKITELYDLILPGVEEIKKAYQNQTYDIDDILKILAKEKESDKNNKNMNTKKQVKLELLGKMYSTLGQTYAFKKDYENSKKYFDLALKEFDIDSRNYHQTLGYLIHLFISENKFKEYVDYSSEFYRSKNILEQVKLFTENDIQKDRYDFFVWIKALYKFFDSQDSLKCFNLLNKKLIGTNYTEHPWQLIYKYMYLNCKKFNLEKDAQKYLKKSISNQDDIGIIKLIKLKTEYVFKYENTPTDKLVNNILKTIDEYEIYDGESLNKDNIKYYLNKYLTYMYD